MILLSSDLVGIKTKKYAFTLVEMLAVISIIVLLSVLAVPALNSVLKTKGVGRAQSDVTEMINLARTEAMAKGTYVWLGFFNNTVNGNSQLLVVAARSIDGTPNLVVNNKPNYRIISKVQKLDDIILTTPAKMTSNVKSMLDGAFVIPNGTSTVDVSTIDVSPDKVTMSVNGTLVDFKSLITFTPQGEAIGTNTPATAISPAPFTTQILMGMRKTAGGQPIATDTDSVGLVLYGGTGQVRVFRP